MSAEEIAAAAREVDELDRETARRVARLVLECRASLKDALAAVHMADSAPPAGEARPTRRKRGWVRRIVHWRERQVGV